LNTGSGTPDVGINVTEIERW